MYLMYGMWNFYVYVSRVTGGELFEDIVAREFYSEADARWVLCLAENGSLLEKQKTKNIFWVLTSKLWQCCDSVDEL